MTEVELIEKYKPLAHAIAAKSMQRMPRYVDRDAVESDAMLGLVKAARRFDPDKGKSFSTYAGIVVGCEIMDGVRERDWVPRLVRKRTPDEAKCFEPIDNYIDMRGGETFKSKERPVWFNAQQAEAVWALTRYLSREERFVVLSSVVHGVTLDDIGKAIGISEARCSQIRTRALKQLMSRVPATLAPVS